MIKENDELKVDEEDWTRNWNSMLLKEKEDAFMATEKLNIVEGEGKIRSEQSVVFVMVSGSATFERETLRNGAEQRSARRDEAVLLEMGIQGRGNDRNEHEGEERLWDSVRERKKLGRGEKVIWREGGRIRSSRTTSDLSFMDCGKELMWNWLMVCG